MRSANEISALVTKASRGAGMPLGCAEDFGRAAPALAAAGALHLVPHLLQMKFEAPVLEGEALQNGHPVLAMIAWRDLKEAGRAVELQCDLPAGLRAAMSETSAPVGPFNVESALWARLCQFAERTFVPESEQSRLAGAGAASSDND
ncbi:MAG: DUF3726 domain-containing protein [Planktotalea sp.]|uniref:DUF3726 domain-containing protein n=1 Tax=Planktotalea sp. TaxID=2029877 RepID=UPI003C73D3C0